LPDEIKVSDQDGLCSKIWLEVNCDEAAAWGIIHTDFFFNHCIGGMAARPTGL
jgi:hypothetical protein